MIAGTASMMNNHCQPAKAAVQIEQQAGDRRAYYGRKRDRGHEIADDTAAIFRWKPQRQVKDDAREEAGFGRAQQDADQIEAVLVAEPGAAAMSGMKAIKPERIPQLSMMRAIH